MDGVRDLIRRHDNKSPPARLRAIVAELRSLKSVRRHHLAADRRRRGHRAPLTMRKLLELEVPARAESLKPLRDAIEGALERAGVAPEARQRLKLVVDEAAANVIRHAYGGRGEGEMEVTVAITRGWLRIGLRDRAPPVDPSRIQPARPERLPARRAGNQFHRRQRRALAHSAAQARMRQSAYYVQAAARARAGETTGERE
jgi:sigma-B regulation protein RsbU (phosphoserine phosphatase)